MKLCKVIPLFTVIFKSFTKITSTRNNLIRTNYYFKTNIIFISSQYMILFSTRNTYEFADSNKRTTSSIHFHFPTMWYINSPDVWILYVNITNRRNSTHDSINIISVSLMKWNFIINLNYSDCKFNEIYYLLESIKFVLYVVHLI